MRRLAALLAVAALAASRPAAADPSSPTRPAAAPGRARPALAHRPARPTRSPSSCPRDDGPHDRLTEWWYDTGHLRAADGRRFGFELRRVPRRARRLPGVVGVAPRADRRDRRRVPLRAAERDRAAGRPVAAGRRRGTSSFAFAVDGRRDRRRRRPGRWPAATARTELRRWRRATRSAATRSPASASTCALDRRASRRSLHDGDGCDRLRPGRRLVLLLADATWRRPGRSRWATRRSRSRATPGSTTSGATSSRSAAAAGTGSRSTSTTARTSRCRSSGRPTARYPLVYGTLVDADGTTRHLDADDVHRRRDRTAGPARRRAPPTRPAGASTLPGEGLEIDLAPDGRRSRSSTPGRRPASCTGRARRS